jgi:hypothetical protein
MNRIQLRTNEDIDKTLMRLATNEPNAFDFVFLDDHRQVNYLDDYEHCIRLLRSGGLMIITDVSACSIWCCHLYGVDFRHLMVVQYYRDLNILHRRRKRYKIWIYVSRMTVEWRQHFYHSVAVSGWLRKSDKIHVNSTLKKWMQLLGWWFWTEIYTYIEFWHSNILSFTTISWYRNSNWFFLFVIYDCLVSSVEQWRYISTTFFLLQVFLVDRFSWKKIILG